MLQSDETPNAARNTVATRVGRTTKAVPRAPVTLPKASAPAPGPKRANAPTTVKIPEATNPTAATRTVSESGAAQVPRIRITSWRERLP
jgi:hypothetical protein